MNWLLPGPCRGRAPDQPRVAVELEAIGDAAHGVQVLDREGVMRELAARRAYDRHAVVILVAVPPAGGRAQAIAEAEAQPLLQEAFERPHLEHLHGRVLELLGTVAGLGAATVSMPQKSLKT